MRKEIRGQRVNGREKGGLVPIDVDTWRSRSEADTPLCFAFYPLECTLIVLELCS